MAEVSCSEAVMLRNFRKELLNEVAQIFTAFTAFSFFIWFALLNVAENPPHCSELFFTLFSAFYV